MRWLPHATVEAFTDGGGFFALAAFWIAMGAANWLPALVSCVVGFAYMTGNRVSQIRHHEAVSRMFGEMPCQFAQLDDTHWTVMKFGGEAAVVEMPADYDFEAEGPMPLIEKCVDPELLAALFEDGYGRP